MDKIVWIFGLGVLVFLIFRVWKIVRKLFPASSELFEDALDFELNTEDKETLQTYQKECLTPFTPTKPIRITEQQKGIYFETVSSETTKFNVAVGVEIFGKLKYKRFVKAVKSTIMYYLGREIASVTLEKEEKKENVVVESIVNFFMTKRPFNEAVKFTYRDLTLKSDLLKKDERKEECLRFVRTIVKKNYDLRNDPYYNFYLLKYDSQKLSGKDKYVFLFGFPHITADGVSMKLIFQSIAQCYSDPVQTKIKFYNRRKVEKIKQMVTLDYLHYYTLSFPKEKRRKEGDYWINRLNKEQPNFCFDFKLAKKTVRKDSEGYRSYFTFDKEFVSSINEFSSLCKEKGVFISDFILLSSLFIGFLFRMYGQESIMINYASNCRPKTEAFKDIIGFFVNEMLLWTKVSKSMSYLDLVKLVSRTRNEDRKRANLSFYSLTQEIRKRVNSAFQPRLVNISVSQTFFSFNLNFKGLESREIHIQEYEEVQNDLALLYQRVGSKLVCCFEYRKSLFDHEFAKNLSSNFKIFVRNVLQHPGNLLYKIGVLSDSEKKYFLRRDNFIENDYLAGKTVVDVFRDVCERESKKHAVELNDQFITYENLYRSSSKVSVFLESLGQKKEFVGVCVRKGIPLMCSLFGVLMSSCVYFPLDDEYPEDRLKYMIDDTKCRCVIVNSELKEKFKFFKGKVISIEDILSQKLKEKRVKGLNPKKINPTDNCYIIYTSGSTGTPKGVQISHENCVNFAFSYSSKFNLTKNDKYSLFAKIIFDASISDIMTTLLRGRTLVIVPNSMRYNVSKLFEYIDYKKINGLDLPPAIVKLFPRNKKLPCIKNLIIAGDKCDAETMKYWFNNVPKGGFFNSYGPTEASVCATCKIWRGEDEIFTNIGKPLNNVKVFVMNAFDQLVPFGIPGELIIGGKGVSLKGYLGREELNAEKFFQNPFSKTKDLLYRTGDLVRMLPNGDILFLGRIDFQVKIRGFRIETGEIESVLRQHPIVKDIAVIVNTEEERIVAFVKSNNASDRTLVVENKEFRIETSKKTSEMIVSLKRFAYDKLANYMIPQNFEFLERFPLNPSGKNDRRKMIFLESEANKRRKSMMASLLKDRIETSTESFLIEIFKKTFSTSEIKIFDDFFKLGGNSLTSVTISKRIQRKFLIEFTVKDMSLYSTVEEMAQRIEELQSLQQPMKRFEIVKTEKDKNELSFSQEGLYFIEKLTKSREPSLYMIPFAYEIKGKIDTERIKFCIKRICLENSCLRTGILINPTTLVPYQKIYGIKEFAVNMEIISLKSKNDLVKEFQKDLNIPFKFKQRMFRVKMFVFESSEDCVLFFNFHHLIFDYVSKELFVERLGELYSSNSGIAKVVGFQFVDFSTSQRRYLSESVIKEQISKWKKMLEEITPVLSLPCDFSRTKKKSNKGENLKFFLSEDVLVNVKKYSSELKVTPFLTMLSVFSFLLRKYCRQRQFAVGIPCSRRKYQNSSKIMGFMVDVFPIPFDFRLLDNKPFREFVKIVQENFFVVSENDDVPLKIILNSIQVERIANVNPLFQVFFQFISRSGDSGRNLSLGESLVAKKREIPVGISKFDLCLDMEEVKNGVNVLFSYSTELFKRRTVEKMFQSFVQILHQVVHGDPVLAAISLMTDEEIKFQERLNRTEVKFPEEKFVHEVFEEVVETRNEQTAVTCVDDSMSYKTLNSESNQVSRFLGKKVGRSQDHFVGVCTDKSINLIVLIIGILKTRNCIYFPISSKQPQDRVAYMMNDTKCQYLFVSRKYLSAFSFFKGTIFVIEEVFGKNLKHYSMKNLSYNIRKSPKDVVCYIIFTSGSTGKPKGVIVANRSLLNLSLHFLAKADSRTNSVGMFFNYVFDGSIAEIFPTLLTGRELVIIPRETMVDVSKMYDYIIAKRINFLHLPPSVLKFFPKRDKREKELQKHLHTIVLAGEESDVETVKYWTGVCSLANFFGPTELTCCVTQHYFGLQNDTFNNIGRALSNVKVFVVDENHNILPRGMEGELVVGGKCLALGYINKPKITSQKFVVLNSCDQKLKVYKTGDRVVMSQEGNLFFLGRVDFQVKVGGFRIELNEIENVILESSRIRDCKVFVKKNHLNNKVLIAFVVAKANSEQMEARKQLVKLLKSKLPEYMIPSHFLFVTKLPVTLNGKIDRKKLLELHKFSSEDRKKILPRNVLERKVLDVLGKTLNLGDLKCKVGVHESFFALGCNSILTTSLVLRLRNEFGIKLSLSELYRFPTIEKLSNVIRGRKNEESDKFINFEKDENAVRTLTSKLYDFENPRKAVSQLSCVFLTGATGFCGGELLKILVNQKGLKKIYCLVRDSSKFVVPEDGEKIVEVVTGNLSKELFGIKKEAFEELSRNVDVIIHLGAMVNHLLSYDDHYSVNVKCINSILKLTAAKDVRIIYLSTLNVYNFQKYEANDKNSKVLKNRDKIEGSLGYISSKYVFDYLLHRYCTNYVIFRIPLIIGNTQSGCFNKKDWFTALLGLIKRNDIAPDVPDYKFNMIPVNSLNALIMKVMQSKETNKIINISFDNLTMQELLCFVEKVKGKKIPRFEFDIWKSTLLEKKSNEGVQLFRSFQNSGLSFFDEEVLSLLEKDESEVDLFSKLSYEQFRKFYDQI